MEFFGLATAAAAHPGVIFSSQSNRFFAMSACLLIRQPQNGREEQLKVGRGLGIHTKTVSGGMSALGVWCQKQLIGFSLQCSVYC